MSEGILAPLMEGLAVCKCVKCGCMSMTLEDMKKRLVPHGGEMALELTASLENIMARLEHPKSDCFGCKKCYPAISWNLFTEAFPEKIL